MDKEYLDTISESSSCSLEEYKYVYPRLLRTYVNKLDECNGLIFNELIFIEREGKNHLLNMDSKEGTILRISDIEYRRNFFDEEGVSGESEFLKMMSALETMVTRHKAIIDYLETKKKVITSSQQLVGKEGDEVKAKKHFTTTNWFKVGLLFATGEMSDLLIQFKNNSTKIARHLKNEGCRNIISETISERPSQFDKCIYQNKDKMKTIIEYCEINDIVVSENFINKYNQLR